MYITSWSSTRKRGPKVHRHIVAEGKEGPGDAQATDGFVLDSEVALRDAAEVNDNDALCAKRLGQGFAPKRGLRLPLQATRLAAFGRDL